MSNEQLITDGAPVKVDKIRMMSPVTLAFIGDAVYGLLVREHLIKSGILNANILHRLTIGYVSAKSQAKAAELIAPLLSTEEKNTFRRGRNANTSHVPKNSSPIDYRHATGLEALVGYLYLRGESKRIDEIFSVIFENHTQK